MPKGSFEIPLPKNETVLSYGPGTPEKVRLKEALNEAKSTSREITMNIGGQTIKTDETRTLHPPHQHKFTLGTYYQGQKPHVAGAVDAALKAKPLWENMPWEERATIFLKAADLIGGFYRYRINAATMLGQSKNAYQAEIDAACELADFLRFNTWFLQDIYRDQPISSPGIWNRMEYRPLEGFVFAVTPFNFTAIAGNLPSSPALMGNTVVWKPAATQIYSAGVIMEVFTQAGLPNGVINLVFTDGPSAGAVVFDHSEFAGLHFTGSTSTFNYMWKTISNNISKYKTYPRIVGETGGKDFVLAHPSAEPEVLAVALIRGAFEYQGQKCSAASRAYIPDNIWPEVRDRLIADLKTIKMGTVEDFSHFINAVIDEKSFDNISAYIEGAKKNSHCTILAGGNYNKKEGYFIEPTVILTTDPHSTTMCEEIFGPVLTIYVYPAGEFEATLALVDRTSSYALTGSIISQDRLAISRATDALRHAAGNFYINDKPTGAVVGQQPFGGARSSGTNDKAGSKWNLMRWISPRAIKETFDPPRNYRYPFLNEI